MGSLIRRLTDSVVHGFIGSLIRRFIGSLVGGFIESLLRCFIDSLIHDFTDSVIHWFIGSLIDSVSCARILSCHFTGIATTTTSSFVDAPHNFNRSWLLHLRNVPIGH